MTPSALARLQKALAAAQTADEARLAAALALRAHHARRAGELRNEAGARDGSATGPEMAAAAAWRADRIAQARVEDAAAAEAGAAVARCRAALARTLGRVRAAQTLAATLRAEAARLTAARAETVPRRRQSVSGSSRPGRSSDGIA